MRAVLVTDGSAAEAMLPPDEGFWSGAKGARRVTIIASNEPKLTTNRSVAMTTSMLVVKSVNCDKPVLPC